MTKTHYARQFLCWKKVGNARKMFQNIFGNIPRIFPNEFLEFRSRSSRKKLESIA